MNIRRCIVPETGTFVGHFTGLERMPASESSQFPASRSYNNGMMHSQLRSPEGNVTILSCHVHLDLFFASRQKQQIFQLHARIRENELRAQQFLHNQRDPSDQSYILKPKVVT